MPKCSYACLAQRTAYLEADAQLHQQLPARDMSGCTALVAMILGRQLVVANAGDSRAVLSCSGHAIDLTLDHKPTAPAEKARVLAAGKMHACASLQCDLCCQPHAGLY